MTPPTEWGLISPVVGVGLYVVYYITLVYCLRWLIFDDACQTVRKPLNWPMFIIAMVIFFLTTITLVFNVLLILVLATDVISPDSDVYFVTVCALA